MASCFKNPNKKNLSAKDYTIKKRRSTLFCNLRKNAIDNINDGKIINSGNNEACVDYQGIFFKYKNHTAQLDMLRAFEDFRTDLYQVIQGQLFLKNLCAPYDISKNNIDISNNYTSNNIQLAYGEGSGYGHLTDYFGALNTNIISSQDSKYRNTYAEIYTFTPDYLEGYPSGFKNNKFFLMKPSTCDNKTRPQVIKSGDFSSAQAIGMTILIEGENGLPPPQVVAMGPVIE
jgi:hypothetical protein